MNPMRSCSRLHVFLSPLSLIVGIYASLLVSIIAISFFELNLFEGKFIFIGSGNYVKLFESASLFGSSFQLTVYLSLLSTALTTLLAITLAFLLGECALAPFPVAVALLPWFLPPTSVGVLFQLLLDSQQGIIPATLQAMFGGYRMDILGTPKGAFWAAIVADIWQWLGVLTVSIALIIRSIPIELKELVTLLGCNTISRITVLWVPILFIPVMSIAIFKFFWTLVDFDRVSALTNGGGPFGTMRTIGLWVDRVYFDYGDFGFGAAAMVVLAIIASFAALLITRLLSKYL